jgi:simple sugar transport system permease protein
MSMVGSSWVSLKVLAQSRPFTTVLAAALSLLMMGALTAAVGVSPIDAYQEMWSADLGSSLALATTLTTALPLILVALGFVVAYHAGIFNIGLEGQLYTGALTALLVGSHMHVPALVHVPISLLAGAAAGATWAALPALLKLLGNVNEIVSSLMLNFVAILLIGWLVGGPLKDSAAASPQSVPVSHSAQLPTVFGMPSGLIVTLLAAGLIAWLLARTKLGFEMRTAGASAVVAKRVGIDTHKVVLLSFLMSGGLAGLAGAVELTGNQLVLTENFSSSWGFTGVAVALIGGLSPWGSIFAGLFFAGLTRAGDVMQFTLSVPVSFALIVEAVAVLLVLSSVYLRSGALALRWPRQRKRASKSKSGLEVHPT